MQIGNGGTTGTLGSGNIFNNSSLIFNRTDSGLVVSSVISGSGSISQNGSGTTTLTGTNTYTGSTNVTAGMLSIGNGSTTGSILPSSVVNISSGATMQFYNDGGTSSALTIANTITGSGNVIFKGTDNATNLSQSQYNITGSNNGLSGSFVIDSSRSHIAALANVGECYYLA